MGGTCTKSSTATIAPYDIDSPKILDHYTVGETLGRGAFGVVKAAALRPEAMRALNELGDRPTGRPQVARRLRFVNRPLAVKVMRHEKSSTEGDSSDRLENQIERLDGQIHGLETSMDSGNLGQLEELQWLNEYSENLKSKLSEKRRNQTKKTPRDMMVRETMLLEKCEHRFILQLVETFEDETLFSVIFERCYGSVTSRYPNGVFEAPVVARQSYQLVCAVMYLHDRFVLHRDIKPENLMFRTEREDAEVLLGDFGMAVELRKLEDRCQGCAGTPHFVPPEGFHSYYQSFPSDIWACGCTIYWMLLGCCPFEVSEADLSKSRQEHMKKSFKTTAIYNMFRSTRMGQVLGGWKPQFEHDQTALLARKICHPREEPPFTLASGEPLKDCDAARELLQDMMCKMPKDRIKIEVAFRHHWIAATQLEAEKYSADYSPVLKEQAVWTLPAPQGGGGASTFQPTPPPGKPRPMTKGGDNPTHRMDQVVPLQVLE